MLLAPVVVADVNIVVVVYAVDAVSAAPSIATGITVVAATAVVVDVLAVAVFVVSIFSAKTFCSSLQKKKKVFFAFSVR